MKYQLTIERRALKILDKIPSKDRERIASAIRALALTPRPIGSKKLSGRDAWRLRVGNYRVIYEIQDHICHILVVDVGHRKDIYQ